MKLELKQLNLLSSRKLTNCQNLFISRFVVAQSLKEQSADAQISLLQTSKVVILHLMM